MIFQLFPTSSVCWVTQKSIKYKFIERDRDNRENDYTIIVQPTGEVAVDLTALGAYLKSGTSIDPPLRPIQLLDIALKYGAQERY